MRIIMSVLLGDRFGVKECLLDGVLLGIEYLYKIYWDSKTFEIDILQLALFLKS